MKFYIYFFQKMSTFHDPLNSKKVFFQFFLPVIIIVVIYENDNFQKNSQIELCFFTRYQSPERKEEFVILTYPTKIQKTRSFPKFEKNNSFLIQNIQFWILTLVELKRLYKLYLWLKT